MNVTEFFQEKLRRRMMNDYERTEEEQKQMNQESAARFNQGKTRFDLIPAWPLEELAKVYTYGTKKYSDDNYRKGMRWRVDVLGCVFRHIWKWVRGEKFDQESGLHHLSHACWNCFCLMIYERNNIGIDDRHPYDLDLLPTEEQKARVKVWLELVKQGKENNYNGLKVKEEKRTACDLCRERKNAKGEQTICSDCIR